jgi:hypothetical protein
MVSVVEDMANADNIDNILVKIAIELEIRIASV